MKQLTSILIVACLFVATPVHATMLSEGQLVLDFTKMHEIKTKAKWTDADKLSLTEDGLGWDGQSNASRDVRIQTTQLVAVGWSWRPVHAANITARVEPPGKFIFRKNSMTYPAGQLYARYSPDAKHWSSWAVLPVQKPKDKSNPDHSFKGTLRVPYEEQQSYNSLLREYSRMDVPWKSDEEAAVKWILEKDPSFFEKSLPFIGYIQFLFETQLRGGQRLKHLDIQISYGAGGIASIPRDKDVEKNHKGPWRFKAK